MTTNRIWSEEQDAIFNWFASGSGNLVVQARAGTGKTTTITEAFSRAPENRILYAVFNKKNQVEATGKIADSRVDIKTLHALGYAFIRSVWQGVKPDSFVERDRVIACAPVNPVTGHKVDLPNEIVTQVCRIVSLAKNLTISPSFADVLSIAVDRCGDIDEDLELPENGGFGLEALVGLAMKVLELSKVRDPENRISFDDMVWLPVAMNWTRAWYDLVVVDEAQDMNLPQLTMAMKACKRNGRMCVVGDDRQAIYGFRGAVQDGMAMMQEKLNAAVLGLTTTYRCPQEVVAIARGIVSDYVAAPTAPMGVVDYVSDVGTKAKVNDAILSRTNAPLVPLCLGLLKAGIPARIEGRDIGKALAGIVKKLKARSVPECLTKLNKWADRQIRRMLAAGKEEKDLALVTDQVETIQAIAEGATNVAEIITRLESLFADTDKGARPAVVLSSVHKAKGLEWDHVFVLRPTFRSTAGEGEEANIFYVAVTRAKKHLTLVGEEREEKPRR